MDVSRQAEACKFMVLLQLKSRTKLDGAELEEYLSKIAEEKAEKARLAAENEAEE